MNKKKEILKEILKSIRKEYYLHKGNFIHYSRLVECSKNIVQLEYLREVRENPNIKISKQYLKSNDFFQDSIKDLIAYRIMVKESNIGMKTLKYKIKEITNQLSRLC